MPANPIACASCGGRHGHSMWCHPSPFDKWRDSIALIDELVSWELDGKSRGRLRSKLMFLMCKSVWANEDEDTRRLFSDLMYEKGYHRPW